MAGNSSPSVKRKLSEEYEMKPNNSTDIDYQNTQKDNEQTSNTPFKLMFRRASTMINPQNFPSKEIPDISDEELLEMAIIFEKEHQQ
jgi:hypothetical protein